MCMDCVKYILMYLLCITNKKTNIKSVFVSQLEIVYTFTFDDNKSKYRIYSNSVKEKEETFTIAIDRFFKNSKLIVNQDGNISMK